ncbi:hypothetical protein JKP88DRAFT_317684 [Tribonema minus]|uniref:Uncharacterized protein n=1 Tax=Tribonema minus TaxID=303371 RepID=A0A836CF18_9STRA|nr:hypothetical protein JKP88DRAFT_317684 [Tribonema minus]
MAVATSAGVIGTASINTDAAMHRCEARALRGEALAHREARQGAAEVLNAKARLKELICECLGECTKVCDRTDEEAAAISNACSRALDRLSRDVQWRTLCLRMEFDANASLSSVCGSLLPNAAAALGAGAGGSDWRAQLRLQEGMYVSPRALGWMLRDERGQQAVPVGSRVYRIADTGSEQAPAKTTATGAALACETGGARTADPAPQTLPLWHPFAEELTATVAMSVGGCCMWALVATAAEAAAPPAGTRYAVLLTAAAAEPAEDRSSTARQSQPCARRVCLANVSARPQRLRIPLPLCATPAQLAAFEDGHAGCNAQQYCAPPPPTHAAAAVSCDSADASADLELLVSQSPIVAELRSGALSAAVRAFCARAAEPQQPDAVDGGNCGSGAAPPRWWRWRDAAALRGVDAHLRACERRAAQVLRAEAALSELLRLSVAAQRCRARGDACKAYVSVCRAQREVAEAGRAQGGVAAVLGGGDGNAELACLERELACCEEKRRLVQQLHGFVGD